MKTIELNVSYDKLFKDDEDVRTVEGSRNYTQIHFNFLTDDWKNVKMKVVATSSQTCKVVVESSSRSVLNLLNFGANKGNISDLSDYINNEVYKLAQPGEIIITKPTITFR